MSKFMTNWKKKTCVEKITTVITLVCSSLVIVLALLQLFGVWEDAAFAYLPLLCVNMLAFTVSYWKANRSTAIVNLVGALIILVCYFVVIFLRNAA